MDLKRAPVKGSSKIPPKTADRIVATALQNPELGARRLVPLLEKKRIKVSATSVQNILRRNGLETRAKRFAKVKDRKKKAPVQIPPALADRIVKLSLKNPDWGARQLAAALAKKNIDVSESRVYGILKRNNLQTRAKRMAKFEAPLQKARRPKSQPKKKPARIGTEAAKRICEIALQNPELGPKRLVTLLKKQKIFTSSSAVYRILKRHGLQTKQKRLAAVVEKVSAPVVFPKKFSDRIPAEVEDRIVELSLQNPEFGARRLVRFLQEEDIFVSASSVYTILKHNNIENRQKRLLKLKAQQLSEVPPEFEIEFSGPVEDELPVPEYLPADLAPMPADDEFPEPVPEPEEPEPFSVKDKSAETELFTETVEPPTIPPAADELLPLEEPEPVLEAAEDSPPQPESSAARKIFFKLTRKKSHWVFYPIYLLLLVLIGYLGFQAVQAMQFANQDAGRVAAPVIAKSKVQEGPQDFVRPLSDYQVIWQRNLFNIIVGKDSDKKNEISLEKIALAKKDIGLELVGTVVADDPNLRRAIIDNRKTRKQDAYREGDSTGKVKIKKILRNNVIITTAKGDELLTVEVKESASRSTPFTPKKSVGSSPSSSQQKARSKKSSTKTRSIALKREDVEAWFSDIDAMMENVRLTPYMQGDQPSGFRISNIPADSALRKMGLRSRDVIVGVDDETITSPDQASDFFQKLAAGDEVTIKVKRRRRTRQIKLNIE